MSDDDLANAVYDILVREAGAPEGDRNPFVACLVGGRMTEWRFGGALGFGGKFYNGSPWRVSCYPEDVGRPRAEVVDRTNRLLRQLYESVVQP